MVYYMIEKPDNVEMNIYQDEIAAIRKKLEAKYPATKCGSWNAQEEYGRKKFEREMGLFWKEYEILTEPYYQKRKEHGQKILDRIGTPMMGKKKADLVRECAIRMKRMKIKKAWVVNYTFSEGRYWCPAQSWYVYEDGGQYFFKMTEGCKTFHKIEGVF